MKIWRFDMLYDESHSKAGSTSMGVQSIFPSVDTCDASDGYLSLLLGNQEMVTLLETNIPPYQGTVEDDVLFHQVGMLVPWRVGELGWNFPRHYQGTLYDEDDIEVDIFEHCGW